MSYTLTSYILKDRVQRMSDSFCRISCRVNFLRAILSYIVSSLMGYIYSYLQALHIDATPIKCRSFISCGLTDFARNLSMILTERKKVSSCILYEDSTSIIQSIILERSCGVISCAAKKSVDGEDKSQ